MPVPISTASPSPRPSPIKGSLHNSISVLSQDQIDDVVPVCLTPLDSRLRGNDWVCARLREEFERGDGESGQSDHNTS